MKIAATCPLKIKGLWLFSKESAYDTLGSNPHEFVQLRRRHAPVEKTELALVAYLVCSVQKSGHCRAVERRRQADALDSGPYKFAHGKGLFSDSHHEIDRFGHRCTNGAYRGKVGEAGRKKHIGSGLFKGLQAANDLIQVWVGVEQAVRPRGQRKRER